jgi:hypothetical protein
LSAPLLGNATSPSNRQFMYRTTDPFGAAIANNNNNTSNPNNNTNENQQPIESVIVTATSQAALGGMQSAPAISSIHMSH